MEIDSGFDKFDFHKDRAVLEYHRKDSCNNELQGLDKSPKDKDNLKDKIDFYKGNLEKFHHKGWYKAWLVVQIFSLKEMDS